MFFSWERMGNGWGIGGRGKSLPIALSYGAEPLRQTPAAEDRRRYHRFYPQIRRTFSQPAPRKDSIYWIMATIDTPVTPRGRCGSRRGRAPAGRGSRREPQPAAGGRAGLPPPHPRAAFLDRLGARRRGPGGRGPGSRTQRRQPGYAGKRVRCSHQFVSGGLDAQPVEPAVYQSSLRAEESMAAFALAAAASRGQRRRERRDAIYRPRASQAGCPGGADGAGAPQTRSPSARWAFSAASRCRSRRRHAVRRDHRPVARPPRWRGPGPKRPSSQERSFTAALLRGRRVAGDRAGHRGKDRRHQPGLPADHRASSSNRCGSGRLVSVFAAPEDLDLFHGTLRKAVRDRAPLKFEGNLLTKDGQRLRVAWSLRIICDAEGQSQRLLLSGMPCFDQTSPGLSMRSAGGKELRASPRRFFQYRQMIARVSDDAMPAAADFFEVDCCDISAGGLSFYLDRVPEFDKLIVALGKPPAVTHFAAQVARYVEKVERGPTAVSGGLPLSRPRPGVGRCTLRSADSLVRPQTIGGNACPPRGEEGQRCCRRPNASCTDSGTRATNRSPISRA